MKICLNCGSSMGKNTDTNCPVCDHVYKKEDIGNIPFGEKHDDNETVQPKAEEVKPEAPKPETPIAKSEGLDKNMFEQPKAPEAKSEDNNAPSTDKGDSAKNI